MLRLGQQALPTYLFDGKPAGQLGRVGGEQADAAGGGGGEGGAAGGGGEGGALEGRRLVALVGQGCQRRQGHQ